MKKKVLIKGATSGIGYATLKELINDYDITFTYCYNETKAQAIAKKYGIKGYHLDLKNKKSIENL